MSPQQILQECLQIEADLGRERKEQGYAARKIDIDVLFVGNEVIESNALVLPHPRLHLRRFTLLPLLELVPDFIHPIFKKTISVLLKECEDHSQVRKI